MPKEGGELLISAEGIYKHNRVHITLVSPEEFSVKFCGKLISLRAGYLDDTGFIKGVLDGSIFRAEACYHDWFQERKVDENKGDETPNRYGMRFYPFISSFLETSFEFRGSPLSTISLNLPVSFRIIWEGVQVYDNENGGRIEHSYGEQRSIFAFIFDQKTGGRYSIKIPVRLGGSTLLKYTEFPIYYWLISFAVITLAALEDRITIMLAAIAAVATFMLRHWSISNPPQRSTLLTHGYINAGILLAVFGLFMKIYMPIAVFLGAISLVASYGIYKSIRFFNDTGRLPRIIERYWSQKIARREGRQKRNWWAAR